MPFSGYPLPTTFTNASPVRDQHPAAHNNTNSAVNNVQDQLTAATGLDLKGNGSPEGVVTAPVGATYRRLDGGTNTATYRKETGSGNTGWVADTAGSPDGGDAGTLAGSTKAYILARGNHTGTQTADTVTDGTTNKAYSATEKTKLTGVAINATANDTDANLKARANHTGTQGYATISDFDAGWEARRRARNLDVTWETGDATAKLGTTITFTKANADSATDWTRSIQTVVPPNSGSTSLATQRIRFAAPTGQTGGNSRYGFPFTGVSAVDSEVRSVFLNKTAGAQMGHFHRGGIRTSSGQPWAFVVWYDVLFGVDSNFNMNTWENDGAGGLIQGSSNSSGTSDLAGLKKWVEVVSSSKTGTTVTLTVPYGHNLVVGQDIWAWTESIYDGQVLITAVNGNQITYTSGTSAATPILFGGPGKHPNGAGIMARFGILPYNVATRVTGGSSPIVQFKGWPVGRGASEPSWSDPDYALHWPVTGSTFPTAAGTSGLIAAHIADDTKYVEFGPAKVTVLDA